MDKISLQNPLFTTYVIAATLMILKVVAMSWLTVARMVQVKGGYRSPEDLRRHTLLHLDWNPAHASWPTWSDWLKAAGARQLEATHGVFFNNMAMTLRAVVTVAVAERVSL